MRCHSVQALWANTPPPHQVVAVLPLQHPPSLWTGSSHGDIIYWKLPPASISSNKELWPMAMLCGHTAGIAHLEACNPGKLDDVDRTQERSGFSKVIKGAVLSACVEGWLCLWDSLTGRCRRRRRLPPWLGSPSLMTALPCAQRYISVACSGVNTGDSHFIDATNEVRNAGDCENKILERVASVKSSARTAIVIIDSLTLTVLHVLYNGVLGMGPITSMVLVPESESTHKLIIADLFGKFRIGMVDQRKLVKSETVAERSESFNATTFRGCITESESAQSVSISFDGQYLLMVFLLHWVIISTSDCEEVIRMESTDCKKEKCSLTCGFFLVNFNECLRINMEDDRNLIRFVICDADGTAMLYWLFNLDGDLKVACEIVSINATYARDSTIRYCQWQECLLCIASERLRNETWIQLWPLPVQLCLDFGSPVSTVLVNGSMMQKSDASCINKHPDMTQKELGDGCLSCSFNSIFLKERSELGEAYVTSLFAGESTTHQFYGSGKHSTLDALAVDNASHDYGSLLKVDKKKWVTASMLLSGNSSIPIAAVFGYNNGDIEIVELEDVKRPSLSYNEVTSEDTTQRCSQYFIKHTAPILCLAEHSMPVQLIGSSPSESEGRVLISGSLDCLLCIWDIRKGGKVLAVLHHHVAPVRQILLPPPGADPPWSSCFLSAGDDGCVALISLETLQVERMFPGHIMQPRTISWDGTRGYVACLCSQHPVQVAGNDVLYIWDLKSGALERDPHGAAAHSMFEHFLKRNQSNSIVSSLLPGRSTSMASLLRCEEDSPRHRSNEPQKYGLKMDSMGSSSSSDKVKVIGSLEKLSTRFSHAFNQGIKPGSEQNKVKSNSFGASKSERDLFHKHQPIKGACPFPGLIALQFDLFSLMAPNLGHLTQNVKSSHPAETFSISERTKGASTSQTNKEILDAETNLDVDFVSDKLSKNELLASDSDKSQSEVWLHSSEGRLLRLSLSFLHLWGADFELDRLLEKDLQILQPRELGVAVGLAGDRGAMSLMLPGWRPSFELWKVSPEFCALRSLTLVAVAQRMITSSRSTSHASSALAAFYTRGLSEKYPDVAPPSLELYACFWQDPSEHVRMAARSLFHCAASRAIPSYLLDEHSLSATLQSHGHTNEYVYKDEPRSPDGLSADQSAQPESASNATEIGNWIDSFEAQEWTALVGGTSQDARAVRIIVGAALAVWYPCLVKPNLATCVAPYLVNLVKCVIDRHSATAAELLADGMDALWKCLISSQIPQLISDIFLLIECLSGGTVTNSNLSQNPATAMTIRETLIGSLLPSLAMTDVLSFLEIVQRQMSVASLHSPIYIVSLMTIIRLVRGAPRAIIPHLFRVTSIILKTMETGRQCSQSAMAAFREMVRVFPMVALHQESGKLAVGDPIGDVRSLVIEVYDLNSVTKLKVLDASGPPGHPALQVKDGAPTATVGISALRFSNDGEGLVAFSLQGLTLRWWSLGSAWWEKLSRATVPVQCTKLVLVPPWAGFSPKSSHSSIMAAISKSHDNRNGRDEHQNEHAPEGTAGKATSYTFDLSYRLEWRKGREVALLRHGLELGVFQL